MPAIGIDLSTTTNLNSSKMAARGPHRGPIRRPHQKQQPHQRVNLARASYWPLTLALVVATLASQANAWLPNFDLAQGTHQRLPFNDYYRAPSSSPSSQHFLSANSNQFYNQPLNSLGPLQTAPNQPQPQPQPQPQYLTPTSSLVAPAPTIAPSSSNSFSSIFTPSSRIGFESSPVADNQQQAQVIQPQQGQAAPTQPLESANRQEVAALAEPKSSITARDAPHLQPQPQPQAPRQATNPNEVQSALNRPTANDDKPANELSRSASQKPADHDIVRSPSPLGKILDAVLSDPSAAQSMVSSLANHTTPTVKQTQEIQQSPAASSTATQSGGSESAPTASALAAAPNERKFASSDSAPGQQRQVLKPLKRQDSKAANSKSSLKSVEQQIINQHARASYTNGQRYEAPTTSSTTPSPSQLLQPQQLRLLPTKYRDNKLLGALFTSLSSGRSQPTSGAADSSSSSASSNDANQPGLLSALVDNFKSGISSRSSIVKAAISDNKLARTLTTVGKTIGGNKYVAGAGVAAALAALGLSLSKMMNPYGGLGSSYSKLGAGGANFEPMMASSSMFSPSYFSGTSDFGPNYISAAQGPDQNFNYLAPSFMNGQQYQTSQANHYLTMSSGSPSSGSMLVAAANQPVSSFESGPLTSYDQAALNQMLQSHLSANEAQGQLMQSGSGSSSGTKNPMDSANGHYSSFYNGQSSTGEPQAFVNPPNAYGGRQQSLQPATPQQGNYISGAPSSTQNAYQNSYYAPAPPFESSDESAASSNLDRQQLQTQQGPTYETTASAAQNSQYDQILPSASSDSPAIYLQQSTGPLSSSSRRTGAVTLKLDEATKSLLSKQLQSEPAARPHLNYEYLSSLTSGPRADPSSSSSSSSSNSLTAASGKTSKQSTKTQFLQQNQQRQATSADSSGDFATFVKWQPSSSGQVAPKSSRFADGTNNKSSYLAAAKQQQGQALQRQFVTGAPAESSNDKQQRETIGNNLMALNSIRTEQEPQQVQTSRNEAKTKGAESAATPAASQTPATHSLIKPFGSDNRDHLRPVEAQAASYVYHQQQPQVVPIVGSGVSSSSFKPQSWPSGAAQQQGQESSPVAKMDDLSSGGGGGGGRNSWRQLANDNDKKSLSSAASRQRATSPSGNESDSLVVVVENEKSFAAPSVAANEGVEEQPALRRPPLKLVRMAREQAQQGQQSSSVKTTTNLGGRMFSWQIPSETEAAPQLLSLMRDSYEVPQAGAGSQQHQESGSGREQDELLRVANNMRTNLIQQLASQVYSAAAAAASSSGSAAAEYQIEEGTNEKEISPSSSPPAKANKSIEADKTNTSPPGDNNNAGANDGGKSSSSEAQHEHNQRHRSQSRTPLEDNQRVVSGDNVAIELLTSAGGNRPGGASGASGSGQRQTSDSSKESQTSQMTPMPTTTDNRDDQDKVLERPAADAAAAANRRAFQGIVAGSIAS